MDLLRVSQLLPHVESTLESFQNVLHSGALGRERHVVEWVGSLTELLEMLAFVIQKSFDSGELDRISEQLALHDRISFLVQNLQHKQGEQGSSLDDYLEEAPITVERKLEPIDTLEVLDNLKSEQSLDLNKPPEDFICSICYEETLVADGFLFNDCLHVFCKECLNGYYTSNIMSGDVNITCPHSTCESPIIVGDIQKIVSQELYQKFENFCLLASLNSDPTTRWCPWPNCGSYTTGERPESGIIRCNNCANQYCYDCSDKYHPDFTCEELKKSNEEDDPKTKKWKKKHGVKKCPHCGLDTIKVSGCPDMLCSNCKRSWNWNYDKPDWDSEGLMRLSETKIETAAFIYPRIVQQVMGSRELAEEGEVLALGAMVGILGIAGIPLTIVCGIPAVAIKSGRSAKKKAKKLRRKYSNPNFEDQ